MKLIKKIITIIIIAIQFLLLGNVVNAANLGETKELERAEKGYYCVQKWDGSKWVYLTYNRTYYTDTNGQKYIAYCLSPGLPGVGYVSGEKESYSVKIKEELNNDVVWRIIKNGYPYKSIQELGVETEDDAYFATMQAVNCVLRGYTLEQAKELYSPGKFAINGEKLEDIQRRGTKTLNTMFNLIDIGLNGSEKRDQLLNISIKTITDLKKDNNNFYSQTFAIQSSSAISEYSVNKIENYPEGSYIADVNGNKKQNFKSGENFKVMIPTNKITTDIKGKISVSAIQKNYPVYYGSSLLEGYQDYALCNTPYSEVYASSDMYVQTNKSKVVVKKVDKDTQKPIEGVKFEITGSNGVTNVFSTNKSGEIVLANQIPGTVIIKEIEAVGNYVLDKNEVKINLAFGEIKEVKIENELKTGNLKIIKIEKDNENIKLENVKFQLKNEFGEVIKEGITDKNGELIFDNIVVGKYKLIETETLDNYILHEKDVDVEIQYNETVEVKLENELKKGSVKIVKTDKDDKSIKLENVKFQLINQNGEIVKEGATNKEGELFFEDLVIGKYKLLEKETVGNYNVNNQEIEIEIKYNENLEIEIENELKKGSLKIIKVDEQDKNIKLEGVKFKVLDKDNNLIQEGVTDENGEFVINNIEIGKYKIIEVETNKDYQLIEGEIEVEVEENKMKEVVIENEKIVQVIEPEPEIETEIEPEPEPEIEPEIESEIKPEIEPEIQPDVEVEEEIEVDIKPEPEVQIEPEKEAVEEEKTETQNKELPKTGANKQNNYKTIIGSLIISVGVISLSISKFLKIRRKKTE